MSKTSIALNNLRAFVIIIVLGFHSALAYLDFLPTTQPRFEEPPYDWQVHPIVDSQRWFGFDLFCAWHDVYLMSLMFFLSGLFVWPSLARKGSWRFLKGRLLRLGIPLALVVAILMPVAHYPSYLVTANDPSPAAFWQAWLAVPFWACGPMWFLWQLLALDVVAAALHRFVPKTRDLLIRWAASVRDRPVRFYVGLVTASAIAYVPMALAFTPWDWWQFGPFGFQWSRPLHYAVYFFAGAAIGAYGIDRGLLATDGPIAKHWLLWLAAAIVTFGLWIAPTALIMNHEPPGPLGLQFTAALGFVLACAGAGLFVLALVLRFATVRVPVLNSLADNAYGIYLIHYVFVVWMQYLLLGAALPAIVKATIVLSITLLASWPLSAAMRSIPLGTRVEAEQRALAP